MKCTQAKCAFHESHGMQALCPVCDDCKAPSNTINDDCVNCWNCLKDLGYVRSGLPKILQDKVKQAQQEKELEVEHDGD